jgi:hypothetical protein
MAQVAEHLPSKALISNLLNTKNTPETSQINNLMMSLKLLEKKEQTKPKTTNRENNKDQGQDQ